MTNLESKADGGQIDSKTEVIECDPIAELREAAAARALQKKQPSSLRKWVVFGLLGSAITAFLSSESHRKQLIADTADLNDELQIVAVERVRFHDSWKDESSKREALAVQLNGVEKSLSEAEQRSMALMSEKAGLSSVIDDLKSSLTMAIGDHQRTEESLTKVIQTLEAKNTKLQSSLSEENQVVVNLQKNLDAITQQLLVAEASSARLQSDNEVLQQRVTALAESLQEADSRERELRHRVTELMAANDTLTKTLSAQKQLLSDVQNELGASKAQLVDERLASQKLETRLDMVSSALAQKTAELDSVATVWKEIPEPNSADELASNILSVEAKPVSSSNIGALREQVSVLSSEVEQVLGELRQLNEQPVVSEDFHQTLLIEDGATTVTTTN